MQRTKHLSEQKQSRFKGVVRENALAEIIQMPRNERSERINEKLDDEEMYIERKILTGIFVDDEFCEWARDNKISKVLESSTARKVAGWVFEYFDEFGNKAPGRNIELICWDKIKSEKIQKEQAEWIEDILESLSDEYEKKKDFNVSYLKAIAGRYRDKRVYLDKIDTARDYVQNGEFKEAALILQHEPTSASSQSLLPQIKSCLFTSTEFIERDIPRPKRLLRPWLAEGSLTMIYGPRGVGKTWLSCLIAIALTREDQGDIEIGPWQPKHKAGVLYIDGEMNNAEMQDNIKKLSIPLPPEDSKCPLMILSQHDFAQAHQKQINLSMKETREALYKLLQGDRRIKLLILDNAAALNQGIDENSKEAWDPINQWLISLRHLGVATILIHHAGKGGQQRGTSGREDSMDTVIKLEQPKGYDQAKDYAWFKISFEKSRNLQPGDSKAPFTLRIVEHLGGGLTWDMEEEKVNDKKLRIVAEIVSGKKNKEIAKMFNVSEQYISKDMKEFGRKHGYLDKDSKPTAEGYKLAEQYASDGKETVGA